RPAEDLELRVGAREPEIAARVVSGIDARVVGEPPQLLAREERESDVDPGPELGAKATRRAPAAALSGLRFALEQQRADAQARKMPRHAGADHARADDHDVRHARTLYPVLATTQGQQEDGRDAEGTEQPERERVNR